MVGDYYSARAETCALVYGPQHLSSHAHRLLASLAFCEHQIPSLKTGLQSQGDGREEAGAHLTSSVAWELVYLHHPSR